MYRTVAFLLLLFVRGSSGFQQYVAFDSASASSTYSAGNLAGSPAFAAQQALSGGSGYWLDLRSMEQRCCAGCGPMLFAQQVLQWRPCAWTDCDLDGYCQFSAFGFGCES